MCRSHVSAYTVSASIHVYMCTRVSLRVCQTTTSSLAPWPTEAMSRVMLAYESYTALVIQGDLRQYLVQQYTYLKQTPNVQQTTTIYVWVRILYVQNVQAPGISTYFVRQRVLVSVCFASFLVRVLARRRCGWCLLAWRRRTSSS